jgi:Lrp/AsnC family transcriptional regulator for asnA, asnC and gidA
MVRVHAEDTEALRDLMFDHIADTEGFTRSQTMVVLGTDYEADGLPV